MEKLTINACPVCGGTRLKQLMTCTDFSASHEQFELHTCEACGFVFTQDAPTGQALDAYYETPDYISHSDTRRGLINKAYHAVRSYMLGNKARLVIRESHRPKGRLLDIGTGTGYFANAMLQRGWQVEAVERNAAARQFARQRFGIEVQPETALDAYAPGSFDVVTLWHVMEHLQALDATWEQARRLLGERGVLIVAAPNCASYDARRYGPYWAAYDVPRHLWHFAPATIQPLASRHGFAMAARYPMPFDAFYISMLSEKYRGSRHPFAKGLCAGALAWLHAAGAKEQSSSMIYVFRKKR